MGLYEGEQFVEFVPKNDNYGWFLPKDRSVRTTDDLHFGQFFFQ